MSWEDNTRVEINKISGDAIIPIDRVYKIIDLIKIEMAIPLSEIAEVYVGMEGFIPETAPEQYCLNLIKEMYNIAMNKLNEIRGEG